MPLLTRTRPSERRMSTRRRQRIQRPKTAYSSTLTRLRPQIRIRAWGSNLIAAANDQIIFVLINYRLGVFGFLSNDTLKDEGEDANGLRDQETAFLWIKHNIQHFGDGPSNREYVWTECWSIGLHMIAQVGGQTSFHKAIMQNGALPSHTDHHWGCRTSVPLAASRCGYRVFLLGASIRRVFSEKTSRIPTIIGATSDEGFVFTFGVKTAADGDTFVRSRHGDLTEEDVASLSQIYPLILSSPLNFVRRSKQMPRMYG